MSFLFYILAIVDNAPIQTKIKTKIKKNLRIYEVESYPVCLTIGLIYFYD